MLITLEEFIDKIEKATIHAYEAYWETIKPVTKEQYLNRWIFAIMSIHTSWKSNVKAYNNLKSFDWAEDKNKLNSLIKKSKVGLHNNRTKAVWELYSNFKSNPDFYYKKDDESWREFRNRLSKKTFFLGKAKTSFAISICYPSESKSICLDTHVLKFLEWDKKRLPNEKEYNELEDKWNAACKDYPPAICREIFWDKIQNKNNSRYWSNCFEDKL